MAQCKMHNAQFTVHIAHCSQATKHGSLNTELYGAVHHEYVEWVKWPGLIVTYGVTPVGKGVHSLGMGWGGGIGNHAWSVLIFIEDISHQPGPQTPLTYMKLFDFHCYWPVLWGTIELHTLPLDVSLYVICSEVSAKDTIQSPMFASVRILSEVSCLDISIKYECWAFWSQLLQPNFLSSSWMFNLLLERIRQNSL